MKKIYLIIALLMIFSMNTIMAQNIKGYKTNQIRDLALIYQGGSQRIDWTEEQFIPYVTHTFSDGTKDWLFDGFLFLEFSNGNGYNYAYGYEKKNARKVEWEWLHKRLFEKDKALDALDKCIEAQKKNIGKPKFRHKIIIGLPIPLPRQTDWGEINGDSLDFNNQSDQIKACVWYINRVMNSFKKAKYKNLEITGFYWVDEDIASCKDLPKYVSNYIHKLHKEFIWIPYWKAKGYEQWKELGFDIAYQQPNHFFTKSIPDSRLDEACKIGIDNNMGMEFECDSKALYECDDSSYDRMMTYIKAFETHDVFQKSAIAYYTGSKGLIDMYNSTNQHNKNIMDRLARHIIDRRGYKNLRNK